MGFTLGSMPMEAALHAKQAFKTGKGGGIGGLSPVAPECNKRQHMDMCLDYSGRRKVIANVANVCKIGIHVFRTSKFDTQSVCGGPKPPQPWNVSTKQAHLRHLQGLAGYTQPGFTSQGDVANACAHTGRVY